MNTRLTSRAIIVLSVICALATMRGSAQAPAHLRLVQTIPLPGVEGRIDHMAVDLQRHRLFVAALGNDTVEVVDLHTGKRIHSLHGLHEPQGVGVDVPSGHLLVANGGNGICDVFDSATLRRMKEINLGSDADNVRYDAADGTFYVGYGRDVGVLDAKTGKPLGSIALAGHPEAFVLEKSEPRLFVNVPEAGRIAVIDRHKRRVIAVWPDKGASANFPIALDEADRRLFVGCRTPARLLVYNTTTGEVVSRVGIAGDADDVFYDSAHKRLYVSCGAGFLDVLSQRGVDSYVPVSHLATAGGARTSLFVPELARLYLAVPHRGAQAGEIRVFAVQP